MVCIQYSWNSCSRPPGRISSSGISYLRFVSLSPSFCCMLIDVVSLHVLRHWLWWLSCQLSSTVLVLCELQPLSAQNSLAPGSVISSKEVSSVLMRTSSSPCCISDNCILSTCNMVSWYQSASMCCGATGGTWLSSEMIILANLSSPLSPCCFCCWISTLEVSPYSIWQLFVCIFLLSLEACCTSQRIYLLIIFDFDNLEICHPYGLVSKNLCIWLHLKTSALSLMPKIILTTYLFALIVRQHHVSIDLSFNLRVIFVLWFLDSNRLSREWICDDEVKELMRRL